MDGQTDGRGDTKAELAEAASRRRHKTCYTEKNYEKATSDHASRPSVHPSVVLG